MVVMVWGEGGYPCRDREGAHAPSAEGAVAGVRARRAQRLGGGGPCGQRARGPGGARQGPVGGGRWGPVRGGRWGPVRGGGAGGGPAVGRGGGQAGGALQ